MLNGGAGATVSVAVAAVDIQPGVMVVAVSVGTAVVAVAGAAELVEIVDIVWRRRCGRGLLATAGQGERGRAGGENDQA